MNGVLNSEITSFQSYKHSYTEAQCLKAQDNFSDLVPIFVTVESVLYPSRFISLNLINPMTANNLSRNAVMHSPVEYFFSMTWLNMLGTGSACTPTVTF
ncbi:MAG: hypothetical protein ACI8P3_003878 [Saprospiraceae bacterium]|jgi:hypothetical protein